MNHTERIIQVARQVRGLTRENACQAIELYLESAADELAHGERVVLPSIGKLHIVIRQNSGRIVADIHADRAHLRTPGTRVQACLRLNDVFKAQCRRTLSSDKAGSTRVEPGEPSSNRVEPGLNPVSSNRKTSN